MNDPKKMPPATGVDISSMPEDASGGSAAATPRWRDLGALSDRESLQPDLGRAIRSTIAYMLPVALALAGMLPVAVTFVALAAQNIAMIDVRGDYRVRLGLFLAMTGVFTGAAALGSWTAGNLFAAIAATAFMVFCAGLWRHLSSDYGMSLGISSTLVFLLALNTPGPGLIERNALAACVGGLWGLLLQVAHWPFRPQHPLRRPVADSWLALSDVFAHMLPADTEAIPLHEARMSAEEVVLRTTLDKTSATLSAARAGPLRQRLEVLHLAAARFATLQVILNTALEQVAATEGFSVLAPALQPVFVALKNTTRTVALTIVSGQPGHLAAAEVRLRRLTNLLRVAQARMDEAGPDAAARRQFAQILRQMENFLPTILEGLRATINRSGERAAFSLELLDVETWTLRPLASALNLTWRVDPALVRFTIRLAVLMIVGVVVFKAGSLPHGYWFPFTVIVVLQPDYGSTRQRAAQRVAGTFAGSVCGSILLFMHLPFAAIATAASVTIFCFGYLVKRNYAHAVFFVTLFIVLLTETNGPVTIAFTVERLASTLAGGGLALLAAMFFWPIWERERFPPLLAEAVRANQDYLAAIVTALEGGSPPTREVEAAIYSAQRRAESGNSIVFSSLQRMTGDPKTRRDGIEHAAILANGNQRLTRTLTVLASEATIAAGILRPELRGFAAVADSALGTLAAEIEHRAGGLAQLQAALEAVSGFAMPRGEVTGVALPRRDAWAFAQLTRFAAELSAMLLAAEDAAPPRDGTRPAFA